MQWRIGGPRDDDIDHVKPGDIKVMHRALGAYLSRRDQVQQAIRMVETEDIEDEHGVPFLIVYGISGNTHRFWSIANAREKIGYAPEDDSQVNFADKIAAHRQGRPEMIMNAEEELKTLEETLVGFRETLKEVNRLGGDGMVMVREEWLLRIKELELQREHLSYVVRKGRRRAG